MKILDTHFIEAKISKKILSAQTDCLAFFSRLKKGNADEAAYCIFFYIICIWCPSPADSRFYRWAAFTALEQVRYEIYT